MSCRVGRAQHYLDPSIVQWGYIRIQLSVCAALSWDETAASFSPHGPARGQISSPHSLPSLVPVDEVFHHTWGKIMTSPVQLAPTLSAPGAHIVANLFLSVGAVVRQLVKLLLHT